MESRRKRIMIAGTKSGSGKTTLTCGLLNCLVKRKLSVSSFKCGPDYIDPMFHQKVIGTRSGNLDSYFMSSEQVKESFWENAKDTDISVIEGVMGYYDGIGFTSEASSYSIAKITKTPVILVIDCKGMGCSIGAHLKGFLNFKEDSQIKGVIFNRLPAMLYPEVAKMAEAYGVKPIGYLPTSKEFALESRHLGLVTAGEIEDLKEKLDLLSKKIEETVNIDVVLALAQETEPLSVCPSNVKPVINGKPVRIAVAKDDAFCFLYQDNLRLLEKLGAELVYFSPLADEKLPEDVSGLLLSGGYPELYAEKLSGNQTMLRDIRSRIEGGLPVIAECGGFLFLHEVLEDAEGKVYNMAGVIQGKCFPMKRLQRFGYIELTLERALAVGAPGERIKAHEFHYWESEHPGDACHAIKASKTKEWDCVTGNKTMYAGFPHLYFQSNPDMAVRFLETCMEYLKS